MQIKPGLPTSGDQSVAQRGKRANTYDLGSAEVGIHLDVLNEDVYRRGRGICSFGEECGVPQPMNEPMDHVVSGKVESFSRNNDYFYFTKLWTVF